MLTETFQSIIAATRNVLRNWRQMLIVAVVYAGLLAALYIFVVTREASLLQVIATFVLAIVAPVLFFLLQSMVVGGVASSDEPTPGGLLRRSLSNVWKLVVVTIPLIALAILIAYLLNKAQGRFGTTIPPEAAELPERIAGSGREASRPIDWKAATFSTVRYLFFGVVLPLLAIHVWLTTARDGLASVIKKVGAVMARAFAPRSVLIYFLGFIIFGVIPYFVLFKSTSTKYAWLELFLLSARLAVVFALTLFGWVITVKALALGNSASADHAQRAT
jgi:hypothetical protein